MAFDDVIQHLHATRVVAIITERADGTPVATPIWSVVVDGVPYIRSAFGAGSKWFQNAISGRDIRFVMVDGALAELDRAAALARPSELVAAIVVAPDDDVQLDVSAAIAVKYADEPENVEPTVSDTAIAATLRILPA